MNNYQVYVVSKDKKPLMPTKRFGKVRRLLKSGKAKVINRKPFTIQLLYDSEEYTQEMVLGIDPEQQGGFVVIQANGEIVYASEIELRSKEVSEKMTERKMHRASRRRHRRDKRKRRARKVKQAFKEKKYQIAQTEKELVCKDIKPSLIKFHNRARKKGWLTPTARHVLESHKNIIKKIKKFIPITKVYLEYNSFDIQKLDNPEIKGSDYQQGRAKGYSNVVAYVLCRDKHTCQLNEKHKGIMEAHHVIWRSKGGSDTPENLITLCKNCHEKVHKRPKIDAKVKELFKGIKKRFARTTLLNTIMPEFYRWLREEFSQVFITYGYETKDKRFELKLKKKHFIDAYLISLKNIPKSIPDFDDIIVYQFMQFRRHHRQIIHASRERNYKLQNKIVAKNHNKRTGQIEDSLAEFIEKNGKQKLPELRVLPGKKVKRSEFNIFRKGDIVKYEGNCYVVKGYGQMGRTIGFVGQKKYVLAKDCSLVMRGTGFVCYESTK